MYKNLCLFEYCTTTAKLQNKRASELNVLASGDQDLRLVRNV